MKQRVSFDGRVNDTTEWNIGVVHQFIFLNAVDSVVEPNFLIR